MATLSETCKLILEKGLTKDMCYDFRAIRRYVLCNAWKLMEERKIPFRDAIRESWRKAKEECISMSASI